MKKVKSKILINNNNKSNNNNNKLNLKDIIKIYRKLYNNDNIKINESLLNKYDENICEFISDKLYN